MALDEVKLQEEIKKNHNEVIGLVRAAQEQQTAHGETVSTTARELAAATTRMDEMHITLAALQSRLDAAEAAAARPENDVTPGSVKSYGQRTIESSVFKEMQEKGSTESSKIDVKSFFPDKQKAGELVMAGYPSAKLRLPGVQNGPFRAMTIRDLLPVQTTDSANIEYIVETGFTDVATSTQSQGAAAVVPELMDKPRAKITFALRSESVKTIAHWLAASRQVLADESQLRGYIDQRLLFGLAYFEEGQLLYGSGLSGNIQGLFNTPGIQTYDGPANGIATDSKIDYLRRAITMAQVAEYPVDGMIVNPQDWEDIELTKGTDEHYVWANVLSSGGVAERLWRVPVLVTNAVNPGQAMVGAFGLGATIWDREEANIRISEHHASFFVQNAVAILAEERVGLAVYRPEAFIDVTLEAAS